MFDTHPRLANPRLALEQHLERWTSVRLSKLRPDHGSLEDGIRRSYRAAGLAAPDRIIWCKGPIELAGYLAALSARDHIGRNVKDQVFDQPRNRAKLMSEIFWSEIVLAATEGQPTTPINTARRTFERAKALSKAIDDIVADAIETELSRLSTRVRYWMQRWRGLPRVMPRFKMSEIAVSPEQLASLGINEYLGDVVDWTEQTKSLDGLMTLAPSGCWLVCHEFACWVIEPPTSIMSDGAGRLHCSDGPALQYSDGAVIYAWKGVQVPQWMIEHPARLTARHIANEFEQKRRNTMIDIMTPQRFVTSALVKPASVDETGTLWRASWAVRTVPIGLWCAVEVKNGTPEPDGSFKTYFLRVPSECRTAREAVAWTYGLSPDQYDGLCQRT